MRPEPASRPGLGDRRSMASSMASGLLLLTPSHPGVTAAWAGEAGKRQVLISRGTSHAVENGDAQRHGPNLYGIFGSKAGRIAGFKYPLAVADLKWEEGTLDRRIEAASALLPPTVMAYRQRDPEMRRLVIKFLRLVGP